MEKVEELIRCYETRKSTNSSSDGTQNKTTLSLNSLDLKVIPTTVLKLSFLTHLYLDYNDITHLPDNLGQCLTSLELISLIGNQLSSLPESVGEMTKLEQIFLNENQITQLPASLSGLQKLKVLNFIGNELTSLPDDFGHLISLEQVYGEENRLRLLPDSICSLGELQVLDLFGNKIKSLPDNIGQLINLQVLNLRENALLSLPSSFKDLCSLKQLDLSYNSLQYLPEDFLSSHSLVKLYVDKNELKCCPPWISDMPNLEELSLKSNLLSGQSLSDSFGDNCKKLKVLRLSGNFMKKLPDSLGQLQNLEYIHCGSFLDELERGNFQNGNHLQYLPDNFGWLTKLTEVRFDENHLHALPENIGGLISLRFLDLGQNILRVLPESFGQLQSLEVCLLSRNQIQILPESFGNLTSLIEFRVDNNLLARLPESFCKLTQLKTLDLFHNRLEVIPQALSYLTNLVRLDLNENNFGLPVEEIPSILINSKYAPRDKALSHNWRGRGRKDQTEIEVTKVESTVDKNEAETEQEIPWNPIILNIAMRRNMSLWKSHESGATKREKFRREDVVWRQPELENRNVESSDEEWETLPEISSSDLSSSMGSVVTSSIEGYSIGDTAIRDLILQSKDDEEMEDWDQEADEDPYYSVPIYKHQTVYPRDTSPVDHLFVPDDIHVPAICRPQVSFPVEEGQFDDVDNEDDNW
ncbi:leucine-rich repeat protein SHOC-2 [Lingula anatina]|uniref:Leucine-rich repeat protein SHOC-2 n=1 Tax=Lingula anatina TaxID=7574 RepID=A0A1S3HTQ0_LINAN|nr:leucine-rich repeat protein SHOC-2 [Lingula anatina]XP_013388432.1 leucine-rich repeat protein SHOC-2 [Lingula anatina]XP_013388434.1 leucine-rich repeat protein SHOC-2 [Lingula anatina]|eukprot:XP_013388431.1 leucine-rich repeat protein SHOC-2 [Lingula anatina]